MRSSAQGLGWCSSRRPHSPEISLKRGAGPIAVRPSLSVLWRSEIAAKKGVFVFFYFNPDTPSR